MLAIIFLAAMIVGAIAMFAGTGGFVRSSDATVTVLAGAATVTVFGVALLLVLA